MNELSLLAWLRRQKDVEGIGDDCAILDLPRGHELLVTTDQLVEDVHFRRRTHTAAECGAKALARGLSDIAAMGATPRWAFSSVALGRTGDAAWWRDFQRGLLRTARRYGVVLAGGDLTRAAKTYIDITVLGTAPRGRSLRRGGARAGDLLYVSGPLGRAAARGFRDVPVPRIELGLKLRGVATACMDLSDGLALDLHRLAKESGLAAELLRPLPLFAGATEQQALYGGEDYELLCAIPPRRLPPAGWKPVGVLLPGPPGRVRLNGSRLPARGWDPFTLRNPR